MWQKINKFNTGRNDGWEGRKVECTGPVSQSTADQAIFVVHFAWMQTELSNLSDNVVHVS
jgi:hypothetical protein